MLFTDSVAAIGRTEGHDGMTLHSAQRARSSRSSHGGQAFFAYSTNYLIDVENAIIVDGHTVLGP
jgi:hypothetical protein